MPFHVALILALAATASARGYLGALRENQTLGRGCGRQPAEMRDRWRDMTVRRWSGPDWPCAYAYSDIRLHLEATLYHGVRHWLGVLQRRPESGMYWIGGAPRRHPDGACPVKGSVPDRKNSQPLCAAFWPPVSAGRACTAFVVGIGAEYSYVRYAHDQVRM